MRKLIALVGLLIIVGCSSTGSEKPDSNSACTEKNFSFSIGAMEGAAGTNYIPLIFTNTGDRPCLFEVMPTAQPVLGQSDAAPQSQQNPSTGTTGSLTLESGDQASVLFAIATASNYPSEECVSSQADGVRVTFKKPLLTAFFSLPGYEVCTKLTNTFISGIVAGTQP